MVIKGERRLTNSGKETFKEFSYNSPYRNRFRRSSKLEIRFLVAGKGTERSEKVLLKQPQLKADKREGGALSEKGVSWTRLSCVGLTAFVGKGRVELSNGEEGQGFKPKRNLGITLSRFSGLQGYNRTSLYTVSKQSSAGTCNERTNDHGKTHPASPVR
jgi:hypothetical protein